MSAEGLTSLIVKDIGNVYWRTKRYLELYGNDISVDATNDYRVTINDIIEIEHQRDANDTDCSPPHAISITFPTDVLLLITYIIYSNGRNYTLIVPGNSKKTTTEAFTILLRLSGKITILSTCGIYGDAGDGRFYARIQIFIADWW